MEYMDFLKQMFIQEFNPQRVIYDLIDMIDKDKLKRYIYKEFKENIMYGEIYRIFKDSGELNDEDLQYILEDMGFSYVDIDELSDEEKENYF